MGAAAGFAVRKAVAQRGLDSVGFPMSDLRSNIYTFLLAVRFLAAFTLDMGGPGLAQASAMGTL